MRLRRCFPHSHEEDEARISRATLSQLSRTTAGIVQPG